jgi:hypothetical protein
MSDYAAFLERKAQAGDRQGFRPVWMPDFLFDFQSSLVEWAVLGGRRAIFADCGMGKGPMALVWAENVVRYTNGRVLLLAPLAVSQQFIYEAEKFGVEVRRSLDGKAGPGITVTNYERLHLFNPDDFAGVVCDESSILKSFDGVLRGRITQFMRKVRFRLLCTATAAPNDYIEIGTSSEALGYLGYTDMLGRFFKNDQNTVKPMVYRHRGKDFKALDQAAKWRLKGHAEEPFWRWVCSWARAIRKPSDLGFDDRAFILPPLNEKQHVVRAETLADGLLLALPAVGLQEQREERRRTLKERCEKMAELVTHDRPALAWCHLNTEGDLLERLIPGAVQVSGKDSDEEKEEKLLGFQAGEFRVLVTKPVIGAWGLNFQHCAHVAFFPSHSFEQYYQGVRRCWRFGQKSPVTVDVITTEGELSVLENLQRKTKAADRMFSRLVELMNQQLHVQRDDNFNTPEQVPSWL